MDTHGSKLKPSLGMDSDLKIQPNTIFCSEAEIRLHTSHIFPISPA